LNPASGRLFLGRLLFLALGFRSFLSLLFLFAFHGFPAFESWFIKKDITDSSICSGDQDAENSETRGSGYSL